jgi:hypothetical protein
MLFVLTPSAITDPKALATAGVPKRVLTLGRSVRPHGWIKRAVWWRMLIEHSLVRYVIALAPFPVAMLIWPDLALPISQAPVLMFGIVLWLETSVLSVPTAERRRALIDPDAAARGLDALRARARAVLTRIAARRGIAEGRMHLVIEQSAMARVTPLTLVSVQVDTPAPAVLDLDAEETAMLTDGLFDETIPEALLHRINLAENTFLRDLPLEARSVSAHARLAAMAAAG